MKIFATSVLLLIAGEAHAFHAPLNAKGVFAAHPAASSTALCMSAGEEIISRKDAISAFTTAAAGTMLAVSPALAEDAAPSNAEGPPTDWGLTRQYYPDASKMVRHMRYCTNMEKGTPDMADMANNCKREMMEFVANYRRSNNISGKLSYSNLYTSISVLAGHYASYGPKFPVPEKRRKRLLQEYTDIERAIKRQR